MVRSLYTIAPALSSTGVSVASLTDQNVALASIEEKKTGGLVVWMKSPCVVEFQVVVKGLVHLNNRKRLGAVRPRRQLSPQHSINGKLEILRPQQSHTRVLVTSAPVNAHLCHRDPHAWLSCRGHSAVPPHRPSAHWELTWDDLGRTAAERRHRQGARPVLIKR